MTSENGLQPALLHSDPIAPVIFGVTLILIAALIGRYIARHLDQPTVLGELLMGVLMGNVLHYFGYDLMFILREGISSTEVTHMLMSGVPLEQALAEKLGPEAVKEFIRIATSAKGNDYLSIAQAIDVFSRYGVIFLLFHVGLDSCVKELRAVGGDSLRVAIIGVVAPLLLGFLMAWALRPDAPYVQDLFLGATLAATSIGLTARVLADLHQDRRKESQIIIGAAVIDDVLGLVVLAIVSSMVIKGGLELQEIGRTVLMATAFIGAVLVFGETIIRWQIHLLRKLDIMEAKLFISLIFVMTLAWAADLVGLAPIVGAFAGGLLLLDSQFNLWGDYRSHSITIKQLFAPIEAIMVPIFFVLMGIQVKLETFLDFEVVLLAVGLIVVAIVGKVVSGWGANKELNRWAIGFGMMPRGEVGLIFASIGKSLGVMDSAMFSAVVLMVVVTTLITPFALAKTLGQGKPNEVSTDSQEGYTNT